MRKISIGLGVVVVLVVGAWIAFLVAFPLTPDPEGVDLAELPGPWDNRSVQVGELRVHYLEAGDSEAEVVVLLHGFPDLAYGWRYVIPELATDYHVFAPTLRGYGATDHPADGYGLNSLAHDLAEFLEFVNTKTGRQRSEPIHVIAHDWGASISWVLAMTEPERFASLTVLDVPHPLAFADLVERSKEQARYRGFVAFLVSPIAPRWLAGLPLDRRGDSFYRDELGDDSALRDEDLKIYHAAFNTPDELRGPLQYYKHLVKDADTIRELATRAGKVQARTLALWGAEDTYMLAELAELSCEYATECEFETYEGAGHWLHWEKPTEVVSRWREFVATNP